MGNINSGGKQSYGLYDLLDEMWLKKNHSAQKQHKSASFFHPVYTFVYKNRRNQLNFN